MGIFERAWNKLDAIHQQYRYPSVRSPEDVRAIGADSLLFHYANIHSQRGQDGILAEIFRRVGITSGRFVEFGAWDGMYLSNCRWLFERGWGGVFIEGDEKRFKKLKSVYTEANAITTIKGFVGAPNHGEPGEALIDILRRSGLSASDIDFVSIDVDGPDLEIMLDMGFSPPVILLEGGFQLTPYLKGPARARGDSRQHGLRYIQDVATDRGYEIACFYQDSYLVRKPLFGKLGIARRSADELYRDAFNFMPQDYRGFLMQMRHSETIIREVEERAFGFFREDPLHPDYAARS